MEALTRREALFGPGVGASDTTVLRALEELADHVGADGLPDRRSARVLAEDRATAWAANVAGNYDVLSGM